MFTEPASLSEAVDRLEAAYFFQAPLPEGERQALASWIAARQGQGYAYNGLPGLTEADKINGVRLFSGEKVTYGARARHVMGEEALRVLHLQKARSPSEELALAEVESKMAQRLQAYPSPGFF